MSISPCIDHHVHTELCHHAVGTMEEYVQAAIDNGITMFYFLEHLETKIQAPRSTWLSDADFDFYFEEGRRLQKHYASQIKIGLGCEVGFNPEHVEDTLTRMAHYPFDWVGLSYHFHSISPESFHYNLVGKRDQRVLQLPKDEAESIITAYFRQLTVAVDCIPCDMLCHLDAVLRYHPQINEFALPWDLIDELLQKMADKKITLEINTSGIRMRNKTFPCQKIIQRAIDRGVEMVLGSDSHHPEHVGFAFDRFA